LAKTFTSSKVKEFVESMCSSAQKFAKGVNPGFYNPILCRIIEGITLANKLCKTGTE
jgi:hypothetical protein